MTSSERSFVCAHCGGTFPVDDGDVAAAIQESIRNWGRPGTAPDMVVICDDCYERFMSWWTDAARPPRMDS